MTDNSTTSRWLCANCGDLDYLSNDDLCRKCASEPVAEFAEICCRALCGEPEKVGPPVEDRLVMNYPESVIAKLPDERLRRVVTMRSSGKLFREIADAEHVSIERARQLFRVACNALNVLQRAPETNTSETKIADLLTSVRLKNVCVFHGVETLDDMSQLTLRDFLCTKNCGGQTAREAYRLLQTAGLTFKGDDSEIGQYLSRRFRI